MNIRKVVLLLISIASTCLIIGCNPRSSAYKRTDLWHSMKTIVGRTDKPNYSTDATEFCTSPGEKIPRSICVLVKSSEKIKQERKETIVQILDEQLRGAGFSLEESSPFRLEIYIDWFGQIGGSISDSNMRAVKVRLLVKADLEGKVTVLEGISDGMVPCTDLSWNLAVDYERYKMAARMAVSKIVMQIRRLASDT